MTYIAKKAVRFDRSYAVGEKIPGGVVAEARAAALVKMGLIATQEPARATEDVGVGTTQAPAAESASEAPVAADGGKRTARKKTTKK